MARWRRRWWIAGLVAVAIGSAVAAFDPLARARIQAAAREHGLAVTVKAVYPRWLSVALVGTNVSLRDVKGISFELPLVVVELTPTLSLKGLRSEGGTLSLVGAPSDIAKQLATWREHRPAQAPEQHQTLALHAAHVLARWEGDGGETATVDDLDLTRGDGTLTATFDSAKLQLTNVFITGKSGSVELSNTWEFRYLRLTEAGVSYVRGQADSPHAADSSETERAAASPPPALVSAGQKKVSKRPQADDDLSPPPADPSAPFLPMPDLRALRAGVRLAVDFMTRRLPLGASITVDGLNFHLPLTDEDRFSLAPGPLWLERREHEIDLTFSTGTNGPGPPMSVRASLPSDDGDVRVSLAGGPVPLSVLGPRAPGVADLEKATLAGNGQLVLDGRGTSLTFDVQLFLRRLALQDSRISHEALRGLDIDARARGVLGDHGDLRIEEARLGTGALRLAVHGLLEQTYDHFAAAVGFDVPTIACEAALGSVPSALLPTLRGAHMNGTFSASGHLAFDTRKLDDLSIDYNIKDACRLTEAPPEIARDRFTKPFAYRVYTPDGQPSEETSGPSSDHWTDLDHISPFMQAAVLTTEDGAFLHHHGFNHAAIRGALIADLKARRFVRGASTITMQLAKNLFLSRDKNLSRKLEELILTDYLEQSFTKDEMMELYLNIIEFGPDIHGIQAAADHFFGRKPEELNLAECMFLSSVLPQPIPYHHLYEHGELPEAWLQVIRTRMIVAARTGRITQAQLAEGLTERVVFHRPDTPLPPPRPPVATTRGEHPGPDSNEFN
jgi:hypothetical protein